MSEQMCNEIIKKYIFKKLQYIFSTDVASRSVTHTNSKYFHSSHRVDICTARSPRII